MLATRCQANGSDGTLDTAHWFLAQRPPLLQLHVVTPVSCGSAPELGLAKLE
jgi:hypothetical protein